MKETFIWSRFSHFSRRLPFPTFSFFIFLLHFIELANGTLKYNQRTFLNVKAINFVDPTKHGFRVMLREEFIKAHLAPTLLPTLYISAIPLRNDEAALSKVFYPDSVSDDKQVFFLILIN